MGMGRSEGEISDHVWLAGVRVSAVFGSLFVADLLLLACPAPKLVTSGTIPSGWRPGWGVPLMMPRPFAFVVVVGELGGVVADRGGADGGGR